MARQRAEKQHKTPPGLFKRKDVCSHLNWRTCECPWSAKFRGKRCASLDKWWGVPIKNNYDLATKAFIAFQNDVNESKFVPGKRRLTEEQRSGTTFGDIIQRYADHYEVDITPREDGEEAKDRAGKFNVKVGYELMILKDELGHELVEDMGKDPLKVDLWFSAFVRRRNAERKKAGHGPLTARTIDKWRTRGITIFSFINDKMPQLRGKILCNPFALLEQQKGANKVREQRFNLSQLQALHDALPMMGARSEKDRRNARTIQEMTIRFLLAVLTGIRPAEMLRLRMSRFCKDDWTIHLPADECKGGKFTGKPETLRLDYLEDDPEIGHWVTELKLELEKRVFLKPPHDFIAAKWDGSPTGSFDKPAERLFKLAGIKWSDKVDPDTDKPLGHTWYDLRHEAISRVAEVTGDAFKVQEFARHKDLATSNGYVLISKARRQELKKRKQA